MWPLVIRHQSALRRKSVVKIKNGCRYFHHHELHKDTNPTTSTSTSATSLNAHAFIHGSVPLKIVPVRVEGPNGSEKSFDLLDDGSTTSISDDSLVRKLGLDGQPCPFTLRWTKDIVQDIADSKRATLKISGVRKTKNVSSRNFTYSKRLKLASSNS